MTPDCLLSKTGNTALKSNATTVPSVTNISPSKAGQSFVLTGAVMYNVVESFAGYSKDFSVIQLVKAFKMKKIRRLSREAAL